MRTIGGASPANSGTVPDSQLVYHRISPPTSWSDLSFTELWSFRDLFGILALRDIKLRYKQTALGVVWVILQPLLSSLIESAIPRQFALFGPGWDSDGNTYRSYEGTPRHKWEVYPYFRFGLCYENMVGAAGYVTEKIFDCKRAGAVPVYLGAPNIADYGDQEVFVDRRQIRSDAELVSHLCGVDEMTFKRYREAARSYLAGPAFRRFLPESFADAILGPLGLEDAA